jgi:benzodiazapine receptor
MAPTVGNRSLAVLGGYLAASFAAAAYGARETIPTVDSRWYRTLRQPDWRPPRQAFGPVWSVLYTQMGVSAWLVERAAGAPEPVGAVGPARRDLWTTRGLWGCQLALNAAWCRVFFGGHRLHAGAVTSAALGVAVAATAVSSARISRPAGLLYVPYLAWVGLATALNARIVQLNPRRP